jgi:hypothetical protein
MTQLGETKCHVAKTGALEVGAIEIATVELGTQQTVRHHNGHVGAGKICAAHVVETEMNSRNVASAACRRKATFDVLCHGNKFPNGGLGPFA